MSKPVRQSRSLKLIALNQGYFARTYQEQMKKKSYFYADSEQQPLMLSANNLSLCVTNSCIPIDYSVWVLTCLGV